MFFSVGENNQDFLNSFV